MAWNYTNREPLHGVKKNRRMEDFAEALIEEMGVMRRQNARRASRASASKAFGLSEAELERIENMPGATWTEAEYEAITCQGFWRKSE